MPGILRFGRFELDTDERILTDSNAKLRLGTRAMSVLILLTNRPNTLLSRSELMAGIGGGQEQNEAALRVYVSELRQVLGDGIDGARFIINEHGRGYRFVAPVERLETNRGPAIIHELPTRIGRVIGRNELIADIGKAFTKDRLVTLVGPGGIGKSTAALAAAERIAVYHSEGVRFVDLALIEDDLRVSEHLAASLGLSSVTASSGRSIGRALGDVLLIIDNCEHLHATVSHLVEELLAANEALRVLTTSREPLRIDCERIIRIVGMESPPRGRELTAATALVYSAVDLFVERAKATSIDFELTDSNVAVVAELCRRLDGIPLALEFAAGWMDLIEIEEIAKGIDSRLLMLSSGRRTALPRHRTLNGVLDWSYRTLSERDQELLEALSTFRGGFAVESAYALAGPGWSALDVERTVERLSDKSLITVNRRGNRPRYRLLETTRSYAMKLLLSKPIYHEVRARHALHCIDLVSGADKHLISVERREWLQRYMPLLADVQYAFDWCFSPNGNGEIGVALAQESIQLGMQSVVPDTFRAYFASALDFARTRQTIDTAAYQRLAFAHAMIQMDKDGETTSHKIILQNHSSGSDLNTPEIMASGFADAFTEGDYIKAGHYAALIHAFGEAEGIPEVMFAGKRMTSQVMHHLGRHKEAKELAHQVLNCPMKFLPFTSTWHHISMRINLARIAFIEGETDLAIGYSTEATTLAMDSNPITLCQTLTHSAIPISIWSGDFDAGTKYYQLLKGTSDGQGLRFWLDWTEGIGLAMELLSREGGRSEDAVLFALSMRPLPAKTVDLLTTLDPRLLTSLAGERVDQGKVGWCAPEVIRARALASQDAETRRSLLKRARSLAIEQGAVAWTARSEIDLFDS